MCGRFVRYATWAELQAALGVLTSVELPPNYNVAPTHQILVVRDQDGKREGVAMRWGLIPSWAKDKKAPQINARAETAAEKPMFRAAFKKRRCLIIADGYFEWLRSGKEKKPHLYQMKDGKSFAFAGLWETWYGEEKPIESCTILTTAANELAAEVHDRMPVILTREGALAWIDPDISEPEKLKGLLQPLPAPLMACTPVGMLVNSVKNNSPECIVPAV